MTLRDFQQDFNKNFNENIKKIKDIVKEVTSAVIEQAEESPMKRSLSSALDLLRPHSRSLGVRISRLSDLAIEVVLPVKIRNVDEKGFLLEAVIASTGVEALRMLIHRNIATKELYFHCKKFEFESSRPSRQELRGRALLSEAQRETLFAELDRMKKSYLKLPVLFFDQQEQLCAQLVVEVELSFQQSIEWK